MFLLDIRYDIQKSMVTKWIRDDTGTRPVREVYHPRIYLSGRTEMQPLVASLPGVREVHIEKKSTGLDCVPEDLLCATVDPGAIYETASILEAKGCGLYNIDLDPVRQYLLEHSLFPMIKLDGTDMQNAIDYELPDLSIMKLSVTPVKKRGISTPDDPICSITLGDIVHEDCEAELLEMVSREVASIDPDIILTEHGDSFDLPYLYHRAALHDIDVQLGREKDIVPDGSGKSYFSYGRILYKPGRFLLSGRLHLDESSFVFREGGLPGLLDLARITGIPVQELSRLSPGSAVTALQVNQAIQDGVLVPWKRNLAEYWKTAEELLAADRGALVIEPKVGLHENVFEVDFVSLFPNIMVNHNISPETVLCPCCPESRKRVPFLHYNICQRRTGLVPRVLAPLIKRRMIYKKRITEEPSRAEENEKKQNLLKWLLVTSFGYMGFNKARFGRIECHESITAYGRDILLSTMEIADSMGYEILHGIVDCLWVKGHHPERLCELATRKIGIQLEMKGEFRWIVFLPNKSNGTGALNRYYGVMKNGKLKVRGIDMRRSDTPPIISSLQESMLNVLAEAKNASEFYIKIPETIEVLREYMKKVLEYECVPSDMVFETRISRGFKDYRQFNDRAAALRQYRQEGIEIEPGQRVRYIITDHRSKNYSRRVIIPELANPDTGYDSAKYCEYLLRAAESILLPFGYTKKRLAEIIKRKVQGDLSEYLMN